MDGVFAVDRLFLAGIRGEAISDDALESDVLLDAYNAGRRHAGREAAQIIETKLTNGARSRVDSEHPANFRADA